MPTGIELFFSSFTNEKRSDLFVKANHPHGDYSVSASPSSEELQSIMLASNMINYDSSTQGVNDIAAEFTDFIINTALHHRELDNPRSRYANANQVLIGNAVSSTVNITTQCNTLLNKQLPQNINLRCVSRDELKTIIDSLDRTGITRGMNVNNRLQTLYQNPCTLMDNVIVPPPNVTLQSLNLQSTQGQTVKSMLDQCSNVAGDIKDKFVIVERGATVGYSSLASFLLHIITENCSNTNPDPARDMNIFRYNDAIYEDIRTNAQGNPKLVDIFKRYMPNLVQQNRNEAGRQNQNIGASIDVDTNTVDVIAQFDDNESIFQTWVNSANGGDLQNTLMEDYISLISRDNANGVTPADIKANKCIVLSSQIIPILIVRNILRASPQLNNLTQEMVNQSTRVLESVNNICQQTLVQGIPGRQADAIRGQRVSNANLELLRRMKQSDHDTVNFLKSFCNVVRTTQNTGSEIVDIDSLTLNDINASNNIRINLKKADSVPDDRRQQSITLFSSLLPDVPANVVKHVSNNGQTIRIFNMSLRAIYNRVYNFGNIGVAGVNINTMRPIRPFPINHIKTIKNALSNVKQVMDGELYDFITNTTWKREGHHLYKIDNGQKIPVSDNQDDILNSIKNSSNCYASLLPYNSSDPRCDDVFNCLKSDNTDDLNKCLSNLRGNHFQQAVTDAKKGNPYVVVMILKKIGVKMKTTLVTKSNKTMTINEPMSKDEWLNSMNDSMRKSISSNTDFVNYVNGLITYLTNNPTILNKDFNSNYQPVSTVPSGVPELKPWNPIVTNNPSVTSTILSTMAPVRFNPINVSQSLPLPFNNTVIGATLGPAITVNSMTGGGDPVSISHIQQLMDPQNIHIQNASDVHRQAFGRIRNELKRIGYELSESDISKVTQAISHLEKQEVNLQKLHNVLIKLINYGTSKGIDCRRIPDNQPSQLPNVVNSTDLSSIKTDHDLQTYLHTNIKEVERCMNNNYRINCGIQNDLFHQVYPSLLQGPAAHESEFKEMRIE